MAAEELVRGRWQGMHKTAKSTVPCSTAIGTQNHWGDVYPHLLLRLPCSCEQGGPGQSLQLLLLLLLLLLL